MNPKLSALLLVLVSACGGPLKYQLASTPKAPGADAELSVDVHEAQHQTEVHLMLKNLPPPARVSDAATSYVAWSRKNSDGVWARLGGVDYNADSRDGQLSGSVAELAFDFTITAEKSNSPASPSADLVFSQRVGE